MKFIRRFLVEGPGALNHDPFPGGIAPAGTTVRVRPFGIAQAGRRPRSEAMLTMANIDRAAHAGETVPHGTGMEVVLTDERARIGAAVALVGLLGLSQAMRNPGRSVQS